MSRRLVLVFSATTGRHFIARGNYRVDQDDGLHGILSIDWQKTAQSRARIRDALEEALNEGLPRA